MENQCDKFNKNEKILFANGDYAVHTCVIRDPVLQVDITAYGVYNTTTGVREVEARRLTSAIDVCNRIAAELFELATEQLPLPLEEKEGWQAKRQ